MNNNYYLGIVVAVDNHELLTKSKEHREIIADVPGVIEGILAYPKSSELDEPKVGDPVILECLDPIHNSYFTYYKLKENNFIGIRAAGKMISITPDNITIGIFDKDTSYSDDEIPESKTTIKIDSDGNIEVVSENNIHVTSNNDINIESKGNISIDAGNNEVSLKNVSSLKTAGGQSIANGTGGFCGIPICPFTGAAHVSNEITGIHE